jgi:putative endonuclease
MLAMTAPGAMTARRARGTTTPKQACGVTTAKRASGATGHHAGLAAEESIARDYERRGQPISDRRWRGAAGEIDLVARDGDTLVFIEVKKARDFDRAAARITPRQTARLFAAAEEYAATQPMGALSDMRLDVALVDGQGGLRVIENAFA